MNAEKEVKLLKQKIQQWATLYKSLKKDGKQLDSANNFKKIVATVLPSVNAITKKGTAIREQGGTSAPPTVIDSKTINSGQVDDYNEPILYESMLDPNTGEYHEAYEAFAATPSGKLMLERFSSDQNQTKLENLDGCNGGDMTKHILTFLKYPPMGVGGFTSVLLQLKNKKTVHLSKINANHIQQSDLIFVFYICINGGNLEDNVDGAWVLGHEVFLHMDKYVDGIRKLEYRLSKGKIKRTDYAAIASFLNQLSAERGDYGCFDHQEFHENGNEEAKQYAQELKKSKVLTTQERKKVDQIVEEDRSKYKHDKCD